VIDMLTIDPNVPPEHREDIERNVGIMAEHMTTATQDPNWNSRYSVVSLSHVVANTVAAGAPNKEEAIAKIEMFCTQMGIIVQKAYEK
jgi:hypothetical protein